jgi:cystathionine beta-lyase/cystathionine gamma-synthase
MHLNSENAGALASSSSPSGSIEVLSSIELRRSGLRFVLTHLQRLLEEDRKRPACNELNEVISSKIKATALRLEQRMEQVVLADLEKQIREYLRIVPAITLSKEWMSPSLNHARDPQRGRYCDMVEFASFDYKRDRHQEAEIYEAAFLSELQTVAPFKNTRCYLTSCGMSAVATAISFLRGPLNLKENYAAPDTLYFENSNLLDYFGSEKPKSLQFKSTAELIHQIDEHQPTVVFLDSIENFPGLRTVDLRSLVQQLTFSYRKSIFLILDVTTTPLFSLPFLGQIELPANINILAIESLAKFHQFGLDVGTGGIVTLIGKHPKFDLFPNFREKFGSNLSDVSTATLPRSNVGIATQRYKRACQNTALIVEELRRYLILNQSSFIDQIEAATPLPGSIVDDTKRFSGTGIFNIRFKNYSLLRSKNHLLTETILMEAKRREINIISGTSFGFDTTRIYLTAPSTESPFLRIAPGIEDHMDTILVAESIAAAIEKLEKEYH